MVKREIFCSLESKFNKLQYTQEENYLQKNPQILNKIIYLGAVKKEYSPF